MRTLSAVRMHLIIATSKSNADHCLVSMIAGPKTGMLCCRETWRTIGIYVFAVPVLIYTIIKSEYHKSDRKYGRKERDFL